jgi:hypothetical protein
MRMRLVLAAIGAGVLACALMPPAHAERFRVGRLLCSGGARIGQGLGSEQSLRCVFHSTKRQQAYVYAGRIRRMGVDLGATSAFTLSWAVFARNSRIRPSTLRGTYVGASGNVAVGPGLGANLLVGGSRRTIILQPLSVERSIGFHFAAGVTRLTLEARGSR